MLATHEKTAQPQSPPRAVLEYGGLTQTAPLPLAGDDCTDAGAGATQEAHTEGRGRGQSPPTAAIAPGAPMATYTLRQLKYFVTTVECGSVAEASRKLYIAQPSISTAIKGLEDSFGLQLFIRHHAQRVSLTPGGARFYKKAQELLRMAREFEQNALADNDVVAGQIDIGCFETVAPLYLPRLIAGFNERHPGVEIRLRDGEQQELVQGLTAGRFDLAIL